MIYVVTEGPAFRFCGCHEFFHKCSAASTKNMWKMGLEFAWSGNDTRLIGKGGGPLYVDMAHRT